MTKSKLDYRDHNLKLRDLGFGKCNWESVHCKEKRIDLVAEAMWSGGEVSKHISLILQFADGELAKGGWEVRVRQPGSRAGNPWSAMTVAGGQGDE